MYFGIYIFKFDIAGGELNCLTINKINYGQIYYNN